MLVDGAGHGNVLPQGQTRQRGGERVDFRRAGAVTIDSGVGLLEADAGGQREWFILRELAAQVAGDNVHAFVVEAAAEIGLALNVDQARFSKRCGRGDAHGLAKGVSADFEHAQAIHLADGRAFHIDEQGSFLDHFADARLDQVVALHF